MRSYRGFGVPMFECVASAGCAEIHPKLDFPNPVSSRSARGSWLLARSAVFRVRILFSFLLSVRLGGFRSSGLPARVLRGMQCAPARIVDPCHLSTSTDSQLLFIVSGSHAHLDVMSCFSEKQLIFWGFISARFCYNRGASHIPRGFKLAYL